MEIQYKVTDVALDRGRNPRTFGTLSLWPSHLQFVPSDGGSDLTITYCSMATIDKKIATFCSGMTFFPIFISTRSFINVRLYLNGDQVAFNVFSILAKSINVVSLDQLYAFSYLPTSHYTAHGWDVFDVEEEYRRMGVGSRTDAWRISRVNEHYEFAHTYPRLLVVPAKISDNVLKHTAKFRSKARIPALSYLHKFNMVSITRSSQPMVGLRNNRSVQDEKLVECIFGSTNVAPANGKYNLIIDARPILNVAGQRAMGAGTESMENYRGCRLELMNIENIHVIRDSMHKLVDAVQSSDGFVSKDRLEKTGWLRHVRNLVDASLKIVQHVHLYNAHVLVHCSDGWDRTAQLTSLAQICLDSYYRTIKGLATLVEKEWCAFGHKFRDRCGHLCMDAAHGGASEAGGMRGLIGKTKSSAGAASVSVDSLYTTTGSSSSLPGRSASGGDCLYQIWTQFPTQFEYSDKLLIALADAVYSCQFGNFIFNCERERNMFGIAVDSNQFLTLHESSHSVWSHILSNASEYKNPSYIVSSDNLSVVGAGGGVVSSLGEPGTVSDDGAILYPTTADLKLFYTLYARDCGSTLTGGSESLVRSSSNSGNRGSRLKSVVKDTSSNNDNWTSGAVSLVESLTGFTISTASSLSSPTTSTSVDITPSHEGALSNRKYQQGEEPRVMSRIPSENTAAPGDKIWDPLTS
ncbi:hypothetical protein SeMB42_g05107 [Synchytrium endobioticum]|uniref:Myotubularin phosphatase domain-containing protein n=1 Tax=Synchytrium endobioticum TaxID=286115 RepID=A0A507CTI7_9FUNG|nr:hypothetical protein SeLEV6574_g05936 [Synchytrium endobioticum]TPX42492.1 hypothetical protein SeMB42_g05107 [Synchytrium endobioticum]